MNFYGHKYLGPGNKLLNGEPVDEDDKIAQRHDHQYSDIQQRSDNNFKQDVWAADREAIGDFTNDFLGNSNWHSAVGAIGLGIKHGAERLTNSVYYPGMAPINHKVKLTMQEGTQKKPWFAYKYAGKRPNTAESKQPAEKRVRENSPARSTSPNYSLHTEDFESPSSAESVMSGSTSDDVAMDTGDMQADAGGISSNAAGAPTGGGNKSSGVRGTVELPTGVKNGGHKETRVYTKEYYFRIASQPVQARRTVTDAVESNWCRYNLHDIPVNMLGFYLSKEEILELQRYSRARVINAECVVFNRTARLPFATNTTNSSIGNNNVGVYAIEMENMRNKRMGTLPDQRIFIEERCWGTHINALTLTDTWTIALSDVSASFIERNFENRFEYRLPRGEPTPRGSNYNSFKPHFFPWSNFVKKRTNVSMTEGLLAQWAYKPKNGLINSNTSITAFKQIMDSTGAQIKERQHLPTMNNLGFAGNTLYTHFNANTTAHNASFTVAGPTNINSIQGDIFMPVEEGDLAGMLIDDEYYQNHKGIHGTEVPTLIIGLEPLLNADLTNIDAFMPIHIQVRLTVEIQQGTDYLFPWGGNLAPPLYKQPDWTVTNTLATAQNVLVTLPEQSSATGVPGTYRTRGNYPTAVPAPTESVKDLEKKKAAKKKAEDEILKKHYDTRRARLVAMQNLKVHDVLDPIFIAETAAAEAQQTQTNSIKGRPKASKTGIIDESADEEHTLGKRSVVKNLFPHLNQ